MRKIAIDPKIVDNSKSNQCEPVRLCNEALLNMEKEESYRTGYSDGYGDAMEYMEKLIHEFRTGVRS